jgi:hypothetical protein
MGAATIVCLFAAAWLLPGRTYGSDEARATINLASNAVRGVQAPAAGSSGTPEVWRATRR